MTGLDLKNLREKAGLTQKELGKLIDKQPSTVTKWETGENQIPARLVSKIISEINHISPHLITSESFASETSPTYRKAQAGRSVASNHRVHLRSLLAAIVDDLPEDIYDVFEVEGASMETTLSQGDKLLCRKDTVDNIQDNRVYVLVTDDPEIREFRPSGVWIKRCSHRKNNGYISCRSDNKDTTEPYNTFRLKSDAITEVWYPVMKITHHMADPNRDIYNRLDELESRIEMLEDLNQ